MKINKSELMKNAWANAKEMSKRFGKSAKSYISQELRFEWSNMKEKIAQLKYPVNKIISVRMNYSDGTKKDVVARVEKCQINGVWVENFLVSLDNVSEPTNKQVKELIKQENRIIKMINNGYKLMNISEPEYI